MWPSFSAAWGEVTASWWRAGVDSWYRAWAPADLPSTTSAVPTGWLSLDLAHGVGGFPRGHLSWLTGADGAARLGMVNACARAVAACGMRVAMVDGSPGADLGEALDLPGVWRFRPRSPEVAWDAALALVRGRATDVLIMSAPLPLTEGLAMGADRGDAPWGEAPSVDTADAAAAALLREVRRARVAWIWADARPPPRGPRFDGPGYARFRVRVGNLDEGTELELSSRLWGAAASGRRMRIDAGALRGMAEVARASVVGREAIFAAWDRVNRRGWLRAPEAWAAADAALGAQWMRAYGLPPHAAENTSTTADRPPDMVSVLVGGPTASERFSFGHTFDPSFATFSAAS